MLYRLSKDAANDARFRLGGLLRPIVESINAHAAVLDGLPSFPGAAGAASSKQPGGCEQRPGPNSSSSSGKALDRAGGSCRGVLLYLSAAFKNVSADAANQRALARAGAVGALGGLLRGMCACGTYSGADRCQSADPQQAQRRRESQAPRGREQSVQVAVQAAAALRNLAVAPGHAPLFLQPAAQQAAPAAAARGAGGSGWTGSRPGTALAGGDKEAGDTCLQALLAAAAAHPGEQELQLNVSRCLSKLSNDAYSLDALDASPGAMLLLLRLAERHCACAPLLIRLTHVLGNATARDGVARDALGGDSEARAAVLRLLQMQADAAVAATSSWPEEQETSGEASTGGPATAKAPAGAKAKAAAEAQEACIKLLRLLANLATHTPAGRALAGRPAAADVLGRLLGGFSFVGAGELVLNAVAALGNLAYYAECTNSSCPTINQVGRVGACMGLAVWHGSLAACPAVGSGPTIPAMHSCEAHVVASQAHSLCAAGAAAGAGSRAGRPGAAAHEWRRGGLRGRRPRSVQPAAQQPRALRCARGRSATARRHGCQLRRRRGGGVAGACGAA